MVVFTYAFKTIRLVLTILIITYFIGLIFIFFSDFTEYYLFDPAISSFNEQFGFEPKVIATYETLVGVYWAFTTLSTVGFGDYYPVSNAERAFGACILLFGVAIFSYIMGHFTDILGVVMTLGNDYDESEQLPLFFGTLQKFNNGQPISDKLRTNIEDTLTYRWANDKNNAFFDEEGLYFFSQLPERVQSEVYRDFLFGDFLDQFQPFFTFPNFFSQRKNSFLTWNDSEYVTFILEIFRNLQPRYF